MAKFKLPSVGKLENGGSGCCGQAYLWAGAVALLTVAALSLALAPHASNSLHLRLGQHALTISLHREERAPSGRPAGPRPSGGPAGGPLPCEASGYCSLGRTHVWRGDVATNEALRDLLEAVSYKREVIFTMSHLQGFMLEMALNVLLSAQALGYGHVLVLAPAEQACANIPPPFAETISCVWDSRPVVDAGQIYNWWYKRWDFFARIARMGYNPLSLDADTMMLSEFYGFVKSEPFSRYNALFQDDGSGTGAGINCGIAYLQNAHPSGPTVWMAVEHAYRTSRQRENQTHMQSVYPGWSVGDTWEQPYWNLVLSSVTRGKPFHMVHDRTPPEWQAEISDSLMNNNQQALEIAWPPQWRNVTGLASGQTGLLRAIHNLTLPVVDPAWWEQHRKYFYGPAEGAVSGQFMELIRTSALEPFFELGRPWKAMDLPAESFAFLPCWFSCGYAFSGVNGLWDIKPPAAVVVHDVYLPGKTGDWKMYTFKGSHLFHFEVSEMLQGGNVLGLSHPRLLMLAPGVQLFAETEDAFFLRVRQLARLAGMLNRTLVTPNPPCDSMWVGIFRNVDHPFFPLWKYYYDGFQVLQFYDTMRPPFNRTYCHTMRAFEPACRTAAPAHADAVAFLERWPDRKQATPSKRNMLWHAEWRAAGGAAGPPPGPPKAILSPAPEVGVPGAAAVVQAAAAFADWPVLFLGAVPRLDSEDGLSPMGQEQKGCYIFADEPPHFQPLDSAREPRQKWLDGKLRRRL